MSKVAYKTASGQTIALGVELGRGGEGSVYALPQSSICAKIYHKPLDAERSEKIMLMAARQSEAPKEVTSWPLDLVQNSLGQGVGLLMTRVDGSKDVHKLYSPKSRRQDFLRADWRFLIRASTNIARSFAAIHQTGCVIGDVNHGSVLVAQDARVTLIDCDSFQVIDGNRRFLCEVGVETYTPPELQGRPFKGVLRTVDHDGFGLAILIFHLLMMGRHPFSGRYLGAGDMPIDKAITERRFAYGPNNRIAQMERPPGTPDLSIVGDRIASLFNRAFTTTEVGMRPVAKQWIDELTQLEKDTTQCKTNEAHWYLKSLNGCPWCQMERMNGTILFPFVAQGMSGQSSLDVLAFAQRIGGLSHLGVAPEIAKPSVTISAEATEARARKRKYQGICVAIGAIGFAVGLLVLPILCIIAPCLGWIGWAIVGNQSARAKMLEEDFNLSQKNWLAVLSDWNSRCSGVRCDDIKIKFTAEKARWDRLPQERVRRLDKLESDRRRLQLEKYLDTFYIETAKISGVGAQRKAILVSEGIETALDVDESKLQRIPSFGPVTRTKLLAWRSELERSFVFDAKRPIDPRDLAAVEQTILAERKACEGRLKALGEEMLQEHARVLTLRHQLRPRVDASMLAFAQAEVNYKGSS